MDPLNHEGTQKVCFSKREAGTCVRQARGGVRGMLHLDFAAVKERTDADCVNAADHRRSNVWKCHSKHPKDRKTCAMKATKAAGSMLRNIDVDKFQGGQSAIVGDSSDDSNVAPGCSALWEVDRSELTADQRSDLATYEEDFYDAESLSDEDDTQQPALSTQYPTLDDQHSSPSVQQPTPSTQQPTLSTRYLALSDQRLALSTQHLVTNQSLPRCDFLVAGLRASSRSNFGVPAKLYIDETNYVDRMLEDIPADEFAAAVLEPVDDSEIRGSNSGSNTNVTDHTYNGGSASVGDGYNTDGI